MARLCWAKPDDWRDYRTLRLEALADSPDNFWVTRAEVRRWSEAQWRRRLATNPNNVLIRRADRPIAMAALWEPPEGGALLVAMYVTPSARGRGLGAALVRVIAERARERGHETLTLEVTSSNTAGIALYERMGSDSPARPRPTRAGPTSSNVR